MRYLSPLTFSICRWEGGGEVEGGGALGYPHIKFVFSVNVAINYKIVAVITAEMTLNL